MRIDGAHAPKILEHSHKIQNITHQKGEPEREQAQVSRSGFLPLEVV